MIHICGKVLVTEDGNMCVYDSERYLCVSIGRQLKWDMAVYLQILLADEVKNCINYGKHVVIAATLARLQRYMVRTGEETLWTHGFCCKKVRILEK